ncbi:MAG: dihydrofolate synthase, partial [Myxococcales bacterium]|nr:dihydrofolate synthase [Myxococcales bacterium]
MSDSRPGDVFADLAAAEAWLEGLIDVERRRAGAPVRLGLAAIEALLARLGNPERELRVIHVAGSKGKGSTVLLCEALLRALGERVGSFTSPHLERWTERFRIDGAEVASEILLDALRAVHPHVEALRAGDDPARVPSWFDVTTAVAFWLFRDRGVATAVVEVGLGGRLDSTNVVDPAVACITSLELEHTDVLGDTLAAIAREKAGILKPGRPAVIGPLAPEAAAVVEARAKEIGAPLARCGHEFDVTVRAADAAGLEIALRDGGDEQVVRLPLLGAHHALNAALAVAAVQRLPGVEPAALEAALPVAFANVALPGRVERVSIDPPIVVDAAHT